MPGRNSVTFWHSLPSGDGWRKATLDGRRKLGYKLQAMCNACRHCGEIMEIDDFARRHGVALDTPILLVQMRLRCSRCHLPAGYFYWWDPGIPQHR